MTASRTTLPPAAGVQFLCSCRCRRPPRKVGTYLGGTSGLPSRLRVPHRNLDLLPEVKLWRETPASGPLGRSQGHSLTPPNNLILVETQPTSQGAGREFLEKLGRVFR